MPLETPVRIARALADRGYNADREAVTLIAESSDPARTLDRVVANAPDDVLRLTADHVDAVLDDRGTARGSDPSVSTGADPPDSADAEESSPVETEGSPAGDGGAETSTPPASGTANAAEPPGPTGSTDPPDGGTTDTDRGTVDADVRATDTPTGGTDASTRATDGSTRATDSPRRDADPDRRSVAVDGDVTGRSTGTGEYGDFLATFRDRYERLSSMLRGRVNHRPTSAIGEMPGGSDAGLVGLVNDVRSTANGHWLVELEDTTGTFPCLITKDRDLAAVVDELLMDECVAVEGTLSDDAGILFVDALHFPDVPRTYRPSTADRHVQAALVSDVHVGSQEFMADAWGRFADWLHTEAAERVEYLLIAGDMVEGVGVYPDQDEELDIVDIYDQYEAFSEHLKAVPGDMEVVMIPGNHDAVRLAEPQPGFDEELRGIMSAHDARIHGNPATVTLEGVTVLMYHGVSLDEVIAELPEGKASYDAPHRAMYQLLKKRHVAPQYGGRMRLAPEERDYLVVEEVPDVFHTGHVHKVGWGQYHNVLAVNSGCWQAQTAFQRSVNIDPDVAHAPIVDLDTLDLTVRKFA